MNDVTDEPNSYRGTAEKCKFEGETVRHFNAGKLATFELRAPGHTAKDITVNIISEFCSGSGLGFRDGLNSISRNQDSKNHETDLTSV